MIVCVCHNVSDKKIKIILDNHGHTIHRLKDLKEHISICNQCGKCKDEIKLLLKKDVKENKEENQ